VALSKADALTPEAIAAQIKALKRVTKKTPLVLSAHSRQGVPEVLRALFDVIDSAREQESPRAEKAAPAW
jgi:GTP-binding protein